MTTPLDDVPPLPEREQDKVRDYRCRTCGERGHNARSCGKPRPADHQRGGGTPRPPRGRR